MNIDWINRPEGATHYDPNPVDPCWYRPNHQRGWDCWIESAAGSNWIHCGCVSDQVRFIEVPAEFRIRREVLPPLESIVRIVPGDTTIWDVAEQFVGVDCRLKAVFMLEETQMVAVENIASGQCFCFCFWASMVRTPEQAKAEEREAGIENLLDWVAAHTKVDRSEFYKKNWAVLYDAGLRTPVKP